MRFILNNLLLVVLLILGGMLYFIGYTESGLHLSVNVLQRYSPLRIEEANGKLASHFTLNNIHYEDADQQTTIKTLDVLWRPKKLLRGQIYIEKLLVDRANISLKDNPSSPSSSSFNVKSLQHVKVKEIDIHQFNLQKNAAHIELNGKLTHQWDVTWKIAIPHLQQWIKDTEGTLNSTGTIYGKKYTPQLEAIIKTSDLRYLNHFVKEATGKLHLDLENKMNASLLLDASRIKINDTDLKTFHAQIDGALVKTKNELSAAFNLTMMKDYKATAHISLPQFKSLTNLSQPLRGDITVETSKLDVLADFIPVIKQPRGNATGQFNLSGTLEKPIIKGQLQLTHGSLLIPEYNVRAEQIRLACQLSETQKLGCSGCTQLGKGVADLQATAEFSPALSASVKISGKNLLVSNLAEYYIVASPDLTVTFKNQEVNIQGSLSIPKAAITSKNFNETVTLPVETIFIDQPQPKTQSPISASMQIHLLLGDDIQIHYDDLAAQLRGKIEITARPDNLIHAAGELYTVKGTYKAYGQALKILEGRLIYTGGPITNPGLMVRAGKEIKVVSMTTSSGYFGKQSAMSPIYNGHEMMTVGVQITGTFDSPHITLFSVPAGLTQADTLSYLLFGYPQSQITDHQSGVLLTALSAMSGGKTTTMTNLTEKLQDTLGLSELNIESTEFFNPATGSTKSTTTFVVGKKIAPDLYAHYSIGLFQPVSIFNLRYQLSEHFGIQTETSSIDNGADLIYFFEQD